MSSNLAQYLPSDEYAGILEINELISAENSEFDDFYNVFERAFRNQFVLTSDEKGIQYYEYILKIVANPATENLEFRRQRILARFSTMPPFTFPFLRMKLDEIIGSGKWRAWIVPNTYTLYVQSSAQNPQWFHEIRVMMTRIKPCNMVFINVPLSVHNLKFNEQIALSKYVKNYKLNGSWKLDGSKPFQSMQPISVIKDSNVMSIQPLLIQSQAQNIADTVSKVLLNNSVTITDIATGIDSGKTYVEFTVLQNQCSEVTDIKLLNSTDGVLTSSSVYFPVIGEALLRHEFSISEAV